MALRRIAGWLALALLFSTLTAYASGDITWAVTGGPSGGTVSALAYVPTAPGWLFAGTNGGVYLTRDSGAHWQAVSDGLPGDRAISALAAAPNASVVFAGTRNGVFRTRDQGATWTSGDARFADQAVLALLLDPREPSVVYAATTTSVLKSENGGDTWNDIGRDFQPAQVWSLALTPDSSALYAATDSGIFSTRDRGAHWTRASDGVPDGVRAQALTITPRGFFAGTTQGLYSSADGKTWKASSGRVSNTLVRPLTADPTQPERMFAMTAQGLVKSADAGSTWSLITTAPNDAPVFALAFGAAAGTESTFYLGTARGVWKTGDDGANWRLVNDGLVSSSIFSLLLAPSNPDTLLASTRFGLWLSQDRGSTWKSAEGLSDPYVLSLAFDPASQQTVYAGTWGSSIFVSNNGGATFARLTDNIAQNSAISSLAILHPSPGATTIYAGTSGSGVFRSNDAGKSWVAQSDGVGNLARVNALTFIPPLLYAGTDRGVFRLDPSDAQATWTLASSSLPLDEARAIQSDSSAPQTIFVTFVSSGLYRSDDRGGKWTSVGSGAFPTRVRFQAFARSPSVANMMYVGTDRGIYRTDDGGQTWIASNVGLPPSADVQTIIVDPRHPNKIFIGTGSNGVIAGTDTLPVIAEPWLIYGGGAVVLLGLLVAGAAIWRSRLSFAAQERAWAREWNQWETSIANALWTFGQANETNLAKLPRRRLARALQRYAEQHAHDALTLQAHPLALKLDNYLVAQKFLSRWRAAWEVGDNDETFASITSQMIDQLCSLLGFARVDERAYKGLIGYVVRAPALRLKIPPRFPILFIPHQKVGEEDIGALRDLMGVLNMTSYFALIVDLRDAPDKQAQQSLKRLVRQAIHDFIVLDGRDIRNLLAARDHAHRLVEIILDQVDLTVVSPYVTSGPVPENMFFGRDHELKTIVRTVRDTNFAIVGGRKIGKTSVLARVYHLLQQAPEFQPFYLDCQAVQTERDFFDAIDTLWHLTLPAPTPENFRRMAIELLRQHPGRAIVMLFDEIDALLESDIAQGEHLFRILRALSQENGIRYIFCGEKRLSAALHDPNLAFFNFCNVMPLTYLEPSEACRVVVEPMQELGIALERDGALADYIVELTAGHPNIVQYLCQKLIERINQRRERTITYADVDALIQSQQFAEYFATISWGNATPLERLITLLMLQDPETTVAEMADRLRARNLGVTPAQLESAFDGLVLYSILRRDGPKYAFAAKAIPQVLRRSQDVDGLRTSLLGEIQSNKGAPS